MNIITNNTIQSILSFVNNIAPTTNKQNKIITLIATSALAMIAASILVIRCKSSSKIEQLDKQTGKQPVNVKAAEIKKVEVKTIDGEKVEKKPAIGNPFVKGEKQAEGEVSIDEKNETEHKDPIVENKPSDDKTPVEGQKQAQEEVSVDEKNETKDEDKDPIVENKPSDDKTPVEGQKQAQEEVSVDEKNETKDKDKDPIVENKPSDDKTPVEGEKQAKEEVSVDEKNETEDKRGSEKEAFVDKPSVAKPQVSDRIKALQIGIKLHMPGMGMPIRKKKEEVDVKNAVVENDTQVPQDMEVQQEDVTKKDEAKKPDPDQNSRFLTSNRATLPRGRRKPTRDFIKRRKTLNNMGE